MTWRTWYDLTQADCYFSSITENERAACSFFEMARDLPSMEKIVEEWRKHASLLSGCPVEAEWIERMEWRVANLKGLPSHVASVLACYVSDGWRVASVSPDFPRSSWHVLTPAQRREAVRLVAFNEAPLASRGRSEGPLKGVTFATFPIETWDRSDEALVQQFKEWLSANRPPGCEPIGNTGPKRDVLSKLEVWRLLQYKAAHGLKWKEPWPIRERMQRDPKHLREVAQEVKSLLMTFEGYLQGVVLEGNSPPSFS